MVSPKFFLLLFVLFHSGESIFYRGGESYHTDINLERFYILEENVMSNADALVRKDFFGPQEDETEDEHSRHSLNVTQIQTILATTKSLHNEVSQDLWSYLGHPINMLHLYNRLNKEWSKGLDLLLTSTPCKMWKIASMRRYLNFLKINVPGKEDFVEMVQHLARLQKTLGTSTREVATGKLGDFKALEPLSVNDQFMIGKILHEEEKNSLAVEWFELVSDWLKSHTSSKDLESLDFKETELRDLMSTSYYVIGRFDKAVESSKRHLELEPTNTRVENNLSFFMSKQLAKDKKRNSIKKASSSVLLTPLERFCASQRLKPSRQHCILKPVYGGQVSWFCHKKEILRTSPSIILYHDVINSFTMDQLRGYAQEKLTTKSWISPSVFITPQMSVEINYSELPRAKRIRYSAQKLSQAFTRIPLRNPFWFLGWGKMQILNAGRSGMHLQDYATELNLKPYPHEKGVGAMIAFLSEPKQGGEITMRGRRVMTAAPKGSILYYYTTESKLHSLCPALGGSQWVAVQPFYEKDPNICRKPKY